MKCFLCNAGFNGSNKLVRHIQSVHGYFPGKSLHLQCVETGCRRSFGSFSGFRKHLNMKHGQDGTSRQVNNVAHLRRGEDDVTIDIDERPSTSSTSTTSEPLKSKSNTLDMCATAVAELKTGGVSQFRVDKFVSRMEEVFFEMRNEAKETALECLSPEDTEIQNKIEQKFHNLKNPFTLLNSEPKRNRHFSKKWGSVEPIEKVLGTRFDSKRNKTTETYDQVIVTDKLAYVPILETLKMILNNPELKDMLKPRDITKEGLYADLRDGSYFKNSPLFSVEKDALQIQLFYDEFETGNPLGSKKGVHKLGAMYFTLRNFPPVLNSSLVNIHLCALFHSQDIKRYGFNTILEPIVHDLKILETEGLHIATQGVIRGTLIQVTGDNLGLHGLFGFVESFGARYCCRFCLLEKDCFQSVFSEDDPKVILRTVDMHSHHCQTIQTNSTLPHVYGVKRTCLLNSLKYFHTANNFSVDLMHDILEGVAQFEVKLVLQYIQSNFLNAEELAGRIHAYDYGYNQQRNRPPRVKLFDGSNDLGLNATQSWCLLRNMPLLFGDLVQAEDKFWHLLLLLLQLVNIVFSPVLSEGMTIYLKHLIADHHRLFKQLFPEINLIPKHHFLLHYPRIIRNIGPVLHMWCMRYEAKHNFFKKQCKNFKNITLCLARKHQNSLAMNFDVFINERLILGPGKMVEISDLIGGVEVAKKLKAVTPVYSAKWIKYNGTEYRRNCVICIAVHCDMPVFCKIKSIVVRDDDIVFCGLLMETVCFDEHYHAFRVSLHPEGLVKVLNANELFYFKPFDVQVKYGTMDSSPYIVPYCHFMAV